MADLIIKASSNNDLVIQGSDDSPAITIAETGTTTFAENATLSGTANNIGTVTAGNLTASGNTTSGASSITSNYTLSVTGVYGLEKNTITGVVKLCIVVSGYPISGAVTLCTLPVGYRPSVRSYMPMTCTNWASVFPISFDPAGTCRVWSTDLVGTQRTATTQGVILEHTFSVRT